MIRRLAALIRKEWRQLLRDRSNLALGIGLPIVLILIFGYGMSFDVRNAPVAVVLEDRAAAARDLVAGLGASGYLRPVELRDMQSAERLMRAREVDAIVRVPQDFSRRLGSGAAQLQVLVHGADVSRARVIEAYLESVLAQRIALHAGVPGPVSIVQHQWFNAANTSTWFLIPGLIVLITTIVGAFLTALVVAREWERGTLEALFVTPVRPIEILVAKALPYFAVGMIGFGLALLAARLLFRVPMEGSLALILLVSVLYMLVAIGFGLLISAVTRNQFLASQIALVASFMPALMLSGFIFDLGNMPPVVSALAHLLPATHYLDALKTLLLAGNVWPIVMRDCAILALYAVSMLLLARAKIVKRLE